MLKFSKNIACATAIAVALPATALAEAHAPGMTGGRVTSEIGENLMRSANIIGGTVYTATGEGVVGEEDWTDVDMFDDVDDNWETIGTVEDIVLSRDGQLTGLVVEDAGFLGIGDDSVLIEMSQLRRIDDGSGDFHWVTNITEEQFESMPEVEEEWF